MIMSAPRQKTTRLDPNQVLRISDAARETGYSARHLRELCTCGAIRSTRRPGGMYKIRRAWLIEAFPGLYEEGATR